MYPLGPELIEKFSSSNFSLNGRRWKLLSDNNNSMAYLVVECGRNDRDRATAEIKRALGADHRKTDLEMISLPNSEYGMALKLGEEPCLIKESSESPIAIIFDDLYMESRSRQSPEDFYSNLLKCPLRSTRSMDDPEKMWMEDRLKQYNLRERSLRILHFQNVEDRNAAMAGGLLESLDILFCDSSFTMKTPMEQLHLFVHYEMSVKHEECVSVTLVNEHLKSFAESAFVLHSLSVEFFTEDGVADTKAKFNPRMKTMVVRGFPRHLDTFEAREWFVRRIAKENSIAIERTEPFLKRVPGAHASCVKSRHVDLGAEIEKELLNVQGSIENVRNRQDSPWKVVRRNRGPNQTEESFTVHFQTVPIGMQFVEKVLDVAIGRPIFAADVNDTQGPKITPCYRLSTAISRSARLALARKIRSLDSTIRNTFVKMARDGDSAMEKGEAQFYEARIFEEWQPGSETGIIGVMGWSPALIRAFHGRLRKLLEPMEADANDDELFHGIGEVYARSLEAKYGGRVVVDVDKFNRKIRLLGDLAGEARRDLEDYPKNKKSIMVEVDLPIVFPRYNIRLREILSPQKIAEIGGALGASLRGNDATWALEFRGTISAFEKLSVALGEISAEIFNREIGNREDTPTTQCSTCMTPIGIDGDFYRLECGHVLCRGCTNSFIRTRLDEGQLVMTCLEATCQRVISPTELMNILLGDSAGVLEFDQDKLQVLALKTKASIVNANQDLNSCPTADCPGILAKDVNVLGDQQPGSCTSCKRPYCLRCLQDSHEGLTCEDHQRLQIPDESIKQWVADAGDRVKRCPKCTTMVEKQEGCNHMECAQCHTHFCWVCLFSAEGSGAIYGHMNERHGGHGGVHINLNHEDMGLQAALQANLGMGPAEAPVQDLPNHPAPEALPDARLAAPLPERQRQRQREAEPEAPAPAVVFRRLPEILPRLDPAYYADPIRREGLLNWINNSETREEQDEKIAELVRDANRRQNH